MSPALPEPRPGTATAAHETGAGPEPYEEITRPSFAERAASFQAVPTRGGVVLKGPCPRCGDPMDFPYVDSVVRSWLRRRPRPEPPTATATEETVVPMICTCAVPHPGRPDDLDGCGAYWNVILRDERP
ncbi:hypothetical protein [Streptomyces sp. NPDC127066]|uniref:hypothetical protein n=1 Tax=Streptomyces sp. NPDC127066 TaxID=3347125 RepID=UPI00364EF7A1